MYVPLLQYCEMYVPLLGIFEVLCTLFSWSRSSEGLGLDAALLCPHPILFRSHVIEDDCYMPSTGKNKDISQNSEFNNSNIISFKGI